MTELLAQQRRLLAEKLRVLAHIRDGLTWSLERLPDPTTASVDDPATAERVAAIVDRSCKLQDQLAGTMGHVHAMLGERRRNFNDVVTWSVSEQILPTSAAWLELRGLRNRLTHEYDLASSDMPELILLIHRGTRTLTAAIRRLATLCEQRELLAERQSRR